MPVAKFHELRYNVALILKEMNNLEKRSILQIQDWETVRAAAEKLLPSLLMISVIRVFELVDSMSSQPHLGLTPWMSAVTLLKTELRVTLCVCICVLYMYKTTYLGKHLNSKCITVCSKLNILVQNLQCAITQCYSGQRRSESESLSDLSRCHVRPVRWRRNILFTHSKETSSSASGRNEAEHWFLPIFPAVYFAGLMSHDSCLLIFFCFTWNKWPLTMTMFVWKDVELCCTDHCEAAKRSTIYLFC